MADHSSSAGGRQKALTLRPLRLPDDSIPALRLISDSIAQQSKVISRYLILHPIYFLGPLLAITSFIFQRIYSNSFNFVDACARSLVFITGVTIAMLSIVGKISSGYFIDKAELVGSKKGLSEFFSGERKGWVAEWGEDLVGVVVFEYVTNGEGKKRAEIKAFTVKLKYRGQHVGVGAALLGMVVEEAERDGVEEVVFARDGEGEGVQFGYGDVPNWLRPPLDRDWKKMQEMLQIVVEYRRERKK